MLQATRRPLVSACEPEESQAPSTSLRAGSPLRYALVGMTILRENRGKTDPGNGWKALKSIG